MFYYLIVILLVVFLLERCKSRRYMQLFKQTAIDWTYLPVIGHAYKCCRSSEAFIKLVIEKTRRTVTSNKYGILGIWFGYNFFLVVFDPLIAKTVLKMVHDKSFVWRVMSHLVGDGSAFCPGDKAVRRRKIIAPTFAIKHVRKFVPVFEANAKEVVKQMESVAEKGNLSAWKFICPYALESVGETIFGEKLGVQDRPDHPFAVAFNEYFINAGKRATRPWLFNETIYRLLPVYTRQNYTKKIMHDFVDKIIEKKQNMATQNKLSMDDDESYNNDNNYKSFLELLYKSSQESGKCYTPLELREESLVLILAATDTSATGICFALVVLSQHQDIQEKVVEEITELLGDTNEPITYESLLKLKYMDAVIKETLRLYPPIPLLTRDSKTDFTLPSGLNVPKTCEMLLSTIGMQRNCDYFGEDALKFNPERFLSEEAEAHNFFLSFGYGVRKCPGNLYAMLSLKTTLITILRRYRLLPATSFKYDENNPLRLTFAIMLRHVNNFEIQLEYRK